METSPSATRRRRPRELEAEAPFITSTSSMDTEQVARPAVRRGFLKRMLFALLNFCRRNIFTVVPMLILAIALGYYYYQYHHLVSQSGSAQQAQAQEQTKKIVGEIENLMFISNDSGAQLATITDISKLKGQKFFENAKNGDDLVLFPAAEQAVLYRPSTHKIIQVGPFSPGAANAAPTTTTKPAATSPATTTKAH